MFKGTKATVTSGLVGSHPFISILIDGSSAPQLASTAYWKHVDVVTLLANVVAPEPS